LHQLVAMQLRIFQRHGHVAAELLEKILVVGGEYRPGDFVEQLDDSNDLASMVLDGQAEQRLGGISKLAIKAGIEERDFVSVVSVDDLPGLSHMPSHALTKGNADLLLTQSRGHDRP